MEELKEEIKIKDLLNKNERKNYRKFLKQLNEISNSINYNRRENNVK